MIKTISLKQMKDVNELLDQIILGSGATKPEPKDGAWGNEDDAEYHGYMTRAWDDARLAEKIKNILGTI